MPLAPPVIPVFAAGFRPQPADYTALVQNPLAFCGAKIVFRGHQTSGTSQPSGNGALALQSIDLDPYSGWGGSSWLAPFTGIYGISVSVLAVRTAAFISAGIEITSASGITFNHTAQGAASGTGPTGSSAYFVVALAGGADTVTPFTQGSAAFTTTGNLGTTMEITLISL